MDERQLLDRLRAGSDSAISSMVTRYSDHLLSWAMVLLGDRQAAVSVVDDTFLKALDGLDGFQYTCEGDLGRWLFRICDNTAKDALRYRQRSGASCELLFTPGESDPEGDPPDPVQAAVNRQLARDFTAAEDGPDTASSRHDPRLAIVRDFLASLKPEQRVLMDLCARNVPHEEIGRYVGIPTDHVRVYNARLKERLRQRLDTMPQEPEL